MNTQILKNIVFPTKKLILVIPINVTMIKLKKAIIDLPHTFSKRKKNKLIRFQLRFSNSFFKSKLWGAFCRMGIYNIKVLIFLDLMNL